MNYVKTSVKSFNIDDKDADNEGKDQDEVMLDEQRQLDHGRQEDVGLNENQTKFTEEEVRRFKEFAQKPDAVDLLVDALAPSIWENEDVKKGILC